MNLHDEIARVAYGLYEKRGKVSGHHLDDWYEAVRIVMARHGEPQEGQEKTAVKAKQTRQGKAVKSVAVKKLKPEKKASEIKGKKTVRKKKTE